jgi:hypothetical protein
MEQKIIIKKHKKGGARVGSGRPSNQPDMITVRGLLAELRKKTNTDYEQVLVEDFLKAREGNDKNLLLKYHQLILAKVMNNLNRVEIVDNGENVKQKEEAFIKALQHMIVSKQSE